jgi:hypothetical protein
MALVKLGNIKFTVDLNNDLSFTDEDLFYMASDEVVGYLNVMLSDTIKSDLIKNLPYEFISPGDQYDYCFFYQKAKQNDKYGVLLTDVCRWINNNKGKYDLNKQILTRDFLK